MKFFTVKESEYVFNAAQSEMDNHADTHVFGRNFRVYFTTYKRCRFGDRMENILINSNQCRNYGIPFFDDPTDNYCDIGLAIDENLFIPMGMEGTTCGFDSRFPTLDEMGSCKRITVSQKNDWYQSTVYCHVSLVEKENRYTVYTVLQFEAFSNPYTFLI